MKAICDFCTHQKQGTNGRGVGCGKEYIHSGDEDGYGSFKCGASCLHDAYLVDYFSPRTGQEISIANMSSLIERQGVELMQARYTISKLQERLIQVNAQGATDEQA